MYVSAMEIDPERWWKEVSLTKWKREIGRCKCIGLDSSAQRFKNVDCQIMAKVKGIKKKKRSDIEFVEGGGGGSDNG